MARMFDAEAAQHIGPERIECGIWLGRYTMRSQPVPCLIRLVWHEPGNPQNDMRDRAGAAGPPYHEAEINGKIVSVYEVLALKDRQPISLAHYAADCEWLARHMPKINPHARPNLLEVPLP